jgi:hypothetical protein
MPLLALLLAAGAARAQTVEVDRLELIDSGIYKVERGTPEKTAQGLKADVAEAEKVEPLESKVTIPAQIGTSFGVRYRIIGRPEGENIKLRRVVVFPPPGLQPSRGKRVPRDASVVPITMEKTNAFLYTLDDSFDLVPGIWTFELWYGDRNLLTQSFTLEKPAEAARPEATVTPKTSPPPKAAPTPTTAPKPTAAKPETAPDNF